MRNWKRMLKELTKRPDKKNVRKAPPSQVEKDKDQPLSAQYIREALAKSSDMVFRDFIMQGQESIPCMLAVVDGLVDKQILDEFILKILMADLTKRPEIFELLTVSSALQTVYDRLAPANEIRKISTVGDALDAILSGDAVLFFGQEQEALVIGVRGWVNRGVVEPETESAIRGPREGFTETLRTNTSLIRRKIKSPYLRIVSLKIGEVTRTDIVVVYIENLAKPEIVQEVMKRLQKIKIDGVLESGYIEEMIEDNPYSPFPQIFFTERPDVLAADLLEGKLGIFVDGTPIALSLPVVFSQFLQVSEDYYERAIYVILVRFIRYIGTLFALLAPAVYIAVTTFHQEILPTSLALNVAAGREGVPLSALLEALFMTVALEILQEAGLRLPRASGQAIGIVGALVIGESAVRAGLVSPLMVIIVGLTAISSYVIPAYDLGIAVRILRYPLMFLAGSLGFFGIGLGMYALLIHLLGLRSFGLPYLSPLAPLKVRAFLQDTFVRAPWWALKRRPDLVDVENPRNGGVK